MQNQNNWKKSKRLDQRQRGVNTSMDDAVQAEILSFAQTALTAFNLFIAASANTAYLTAIQAQINSIPED